MSAMESAGSETVEPFYALNKSSASVGPNAGQVGDVSQHPDPNMIPLGLQLLVRSAEGWVANGGGTTNGTKYAPPSHAVAWGNQGCPLLPREIRKRLKGIRLPDELEACFGAALTVDQLDAEVLERLHIEELATSTRKTFRDFLYSFPPEGDQVAIPAGIPLVWFENLPLSGRTRNAVRRAFRPELGTDSFLSVPILAHEFLSGPSVGTATLNELACVVESAELEWPGDGLGFEQGIATSPHPSGRYTEHVNEAVLQYIRGMSSFGGRLYEFVQWAMAETGAQTFRDALAELQRDPTENEGWDELTSARLSDLAARPSHPYEVLDTWLEQMDARIRVVFLTRVSAYPPKSTLEDLGAQFGVTRERIRQIEVKARRSLHRFLSTDEAIPIRWRASTIRRTLSVAAPERTVEHLLRSPSGECNSHRGILLELAGPYDRDEGWLTLRSAQGDDPTSAILTQVDEAGRINVELARSQLADWGLDAALHDEWLMRDGGVRLFNGQLVRWGTSIPDRLGFALADLGHPSTIDEMVNHVRESRSRNSIINALASDLRIMRVSKTHWALTSWGFPEYSGVAESMRNLLEECGGAIAVHEMVRQMELIFGVEKSTTLIYCIAPMFVVEGELLRLRTPADKPFRSDPDLVRRTPGVFDLGPMRLGRLFKVDENMLRGSGAALSHAAGAILGVEVNADLTFSNQRGDRVVIAFLETSIVGPFIGSVRQIAEKLSAKEGQHLNLVLDRSTMTVTAQVTDLTNESTGWETVGRLTGIAAPVDLDSLAKALHCEAGEVRSVLRARGDDDVLAFLPKSGSSTRMEEALAALEEQVDRARGGPP